MTYLAYFKKLDHTIEFVFNLLVFELQLLLLMFPNTVLLNILRHVEILINKLIL